MFLGKITVESVYTTPLKKLRVCTNGEFRVNILRAQKKLWKGTRSTVTVITVRDHGGEGGAD